ncbi:hypothetical protein QOT17_008831 [Balamuthia mandrillaris]
MRSQLRSFATVGGSDPRHDVPLGDKLAGGVKQATGKIFGDRELEAEGRIQREEGIKAASAERVRTESELASAQGAIKHGAETLREKAKDAASYVKDTVMGGGHSHANAQMGDRMMGGAKEATGKVAGREDWEAQGKAQRSQGGGPSTDANMSDRVMGKAKEGMGRMAGNQDMQEEGRKQQLGEEHQNKTAEWMKQKGHEMKGSLKEKAGKMMGKEDLEERGRRERNEGGKM